MFASLPETLRQYGLDSDARTLLLLNKSLEKNLIQTLGDLYITLKAIVIKDPKQAGPFTQAYYKYFLNIEIQPGQSLEDAIADSESFDNWKNDFLKDHKDRENEDLSWFIDRYLDEIHLSSFDIKKILDGKDILADDDPDLMDESDEAQRSDRPLDKMADYSDIDMDELLDRMQKIREKQSDRHSGGHHWIGQGGISPYGHSGAAKGGIRVGGSGGGKMARKVIGNPRYFPVDMNNLIGNDNMDAALASLKGIFESSAHQELDIEQTIDKGLKRGGLFLPEIKDITQEKMQIILLIDNGGYSMDPYIGLIMDLFKKMKTRFAHDMKTFYFHNTIYDRVYTNARRSKYISIDKLIDHDPNYKIFVIGDAAMAPYEVTKLSAKNWHLIRKKFKKMVWLNPELERYWKHTMTIQYFSQLIEMFPLTPAGLEKSIRYLNTKGLVQ